MVLNPLNRPCVREVHDLVVPGLSLSGCCFHVSVHKFRIQSAEFLASVVLRTNATAAFEKSKREVNVPLVSHFEFAHFWDSICRAAASGTRLLKPMISLAVLSLYLGFYLRVPCFQKLSCFMKLRN